jgi:penicillin-binding protein 1A
MPKQGDSAAVGRRARPTRRPTSLKKRIKTFFAFATLGILSAVAIALIYFLIIFKQVSATLPSLTEIGNFTPSEGTKIYYADGSLMATLATINRRPVKLKEISRHLIDATIATEDSRFYEHRGVDYYGIARAIYRNVAGGDLTGQGASTITQQLARSINELGLTREKKLRRKVAEAILAMKIEQAFDKEEILELYLNQIYYGNGAWGVEAAAQAYFHKRAKDLTLNEAAMLAGLPQRPSLYSRNRDAALRRRDRVLDRMVETGKITPQQRDAARAKPLKMYRADPNKTIVHGAPYFVNYVVGQLERRYDSDLVYSGCKIYTTLNPRIQKAAEETLRNGIHHYGENANQGALVCIDPRTGYIRAMVGGLDFEKDQFNIVTQGNRQPGSSFKPILYTAAFDTGVCDLDKTYVDDKHFPGERPGNTWYPKNYSGKYSYRSVTVLSAIKHSLNTIAVKVAMDTGLRTVIEYAHRMGITSEMDAYPTLALGAWKTGVKPIELCSAYTIFANGGKRPLPQGILKVVAANDDIIEENAPQMDDPHIQPRTIEMINQALREVILRGTGTAAADVPDACGKTGTTSDNRDAWFAGYTPDLTTVVWAGDEHRNKKGKVDRYLEMPGATGGHLCAPIWRDFMQKALPIQQEANRIAAGPPKPAEPAASGEKKTTKPAEKKPAQPPAAQNSVSPDGPPVDNPPGGAPSGNTLPGAVPTPPTPSVPPSTGGTPSPTGAQPSARPRPDDSGPRMSEPTGRIAAPPAPRADPGDEMVTVRLCADSMRLATRWCPATVERRMRRRDVPGRCRTHKPPPGEDQ